MAEEKAASEADTPRAGMGAAQLIMGVLVAILLGGGGGASFGYFVIPAAPSAEVKVSEITDPVKPLAGRFPNDALEIQIPSIVVDMEMEPKSRVRLDASFIAVHGTPESTPLKSEVREDIVAFLKGLSVTDIQGVRGFQHLREQLDDRAKMRGRGAILGLLIGGFVLE